MRRLGWILVGIWSFLEIIKLSMEFTYSKIGSSTKRYISKDKLAYKIGRIRGLCSLHAISGEAYEAIMNELRKLYNE
jgi:hypothetical protein